MSGHTVRLTPRQAEWVEEQAISALEGAEGDERRLIVNLLKALELGGVGKVEKKEDDGFITYGRVGGFEKGLRKP